MKEILSSLLIQDYVYLQGKEKNLFVRSLSIQRLRRLIAPHLPVPCCRAFDLGAGQGELVEALRHLGCAVVAGVELSTSQVRLAEAYGCHSVREGDAGQALQELPDATIDLVCCFDVFEHLTLDTCSCWFAEIHRVLRPGGRLIGHVPNGLSPFVGSVYCGDLSHLWLPVPESIQVLCRITGLRWIGAYENIGASQGLNGRLRSLAWFFVRCILALASTLETGRSAFTSPWTRTFLFVVEKPKYG